MNPTELIGLRHSNQLLQHPDPISPEDVVRRMGLIQAQDFYGSLWAVGLRAGSLTEAAVEQALNERKIVRSWPARGTLHYAAPEDLRWMVTLLAPRIIAGSKGRNKQLELDEETFTKSRGVFEKALNGGKQLTREEMYSALESAKISTQGQRGYHILWRMGQERLICFGPRRGKQPTFVLLDEWIPPAKSLDHSEALCEIALRYFRGHGPATQKDFIWWSGLSAADVKTGIELCKYQLITENLNGQIYWLSTDRQDNTGQINPVVLLPPYDEYNVGYADRSPVLEPHFSKFLNAGGGILRPVIVINGIVTGTWKRTLKKSSVNITAEWFVEPSASQTTAFEAAAQRYADYLSLTFVTT